MALRTLSKPLQVLGQIRPSLAQDSLTRCLAPLAFRSMATEADLSSSQTSSAFADAHVASVSHSTDPEPASSAFTAPSQVLTTLYDFQTMEPKEFVYYPANYLYLPLRRDLLHRAVVYEGDMTRQGTASTKWRDDVHGSGRKLYRQKGTGKARVGDKKSPIRRGGGVAFGPHPRDFSTDLPRKMYDIAWRTALSYRYRKGDLIVIKGEAEVVTDSMLVVKDLFEQYQWGKGFGRSLVVTKGERKNLTTAMERLGEHGEVLTTDEVDVKDLLTKGRIIIEQDALNKIFKDHKSDLGKPLSRPGLTTRVDEASVQL